MRGFLYSVLKLEQSKTSIKPIVRRDEVQESQKQLHHRLKLRYKIHIQFLIRNILSILLVSIW